MSKIIFWATVSLGIYILIFSSWYLFSTINVSANVLKKTSEPVYQSKQATMVVYHSTGRIYYKLIGNYIQYFADTKITWFTKPVAIIFDDNKIPYWIVEADQAKLTNDRMLYMYGHVQMSNLRDISYIKYIKTTNLLVNLVTQDFASEDEEVILQGNNFHSIGMKLRGSISNKTAELSNTAKTIYATTKL